MDRAKKQKGKIESLKEQGEGGDGREGGERKEGGKSHVLLAEKVSLESKDVLDGTELVLNILKALCKSHLLQSDRQHLGMTPEMFSSPFIAVVWWGYSNC